MIAKIVTPTNRVVLEKGQNIIGFGKIEKITPSVDGKQFFVKFERKEKPKIFTLDPWGQLVEMSLDEWLVLWEKKYCEISI